MPQSLACIYLHLIWSTKNRMPTLTDDIRSKLHAYMNGTFEKLECPALLINSVTDHVHALIRFRRSIEIKTLLKEVKQSSSKWIKTPDAGGTRLRQFHWQDGYGAFSIGKSQVPEVLHYIEGQQEHHKRVTFQDEYRKFLKAYEIAYDERYVWD